MSRLVDRKRPYWFDLEFVSKTKSILRWFEIRAPRDTANRLHVMPIVRLRKYRFLQGQTLDIGLLINHEYSVIHFTISLHSRNKKYKIRVKIYIF